MLVGLLHAYLLAAAPTPFAASFSLAVQVEPGAWLGPVSLSANGHFAVPVMVGDRTFYAPLIALTHTSQPIGTTVINRTTE